MSDQKVNIKNRKASFNYHFLEKFIAGIMLTGTEIKSIRAGKANINEAYCFLTRKGELFIKNMHITEYDKGTHYNHDPIRQRKLLLTKREIDKIESKITGPGVTIVPTKLFISERGLAKLEIAVATGKKQHDKRESLKEKDAKRDMDRMKKRY